jgi:ADP-heptose:LPS heptosyltransferase
LRRVADEIGGTNYDVLIDFHGRFKSGLLSWLSGVPVRVGFARADGTEGNSLFMNRQVKLADHWENRVHRFLRLLEPIGLPTDYDPQALGLHVDPDARMKARAWYDGIGRPPLIAYPGTSLHRIDERWPAEKWIELLRALNARGVRTVLFWGPAEEEFTRGIAERAEVPMAPRTTLPEMMAMLGCFRAFVGSDTGAMHMAWMQNVPAAVFMGPKPLRTAAPPPPANARLLRAEEYYVEALSPGRQSAELVRAVPVSDALRAVEELLA